MKPFGGLSVFSLLLSIVLIVFLYAAGSSADAQEAGGGPQESTGPYPIEPSEEHKAFQMEVGVWDADITMWMEGPDKPSKSKGVETVKMFGDFWLVTDLEYEFMGQQALGHGLISYDPSIKKYVGTWHDSSSPYISNMVGTLDKTTGRITYDMKSKDPTGQEMVYKIVTKAGEKTKVFELHAKVADKDEFIKILQMDYTKR